MEATIKKLFESKIRRFEVPTYQRAYSWEEKQILQFVEDLRSSGGKYYLGHFLFEQKSEGTFYIIDGQQRLTTVVIFFSSLVQELMKRKEDGETLSIDLADLLDYYVKDYRKNTQKLITSKDDNNFFLEEVINSRVDHKQAADTASKRRIRAAKKYFDDCFRAESTNQLEAWCQLVEDATVTEYIVTNKIQATQVFAFQNDRGKKLSKLEVLKAYFMLLIYMSGDSDDHIEDNIRYLEQEISKIYQQIERITLDEDDVLNHYWRTVSGKGFYSDEVISGIKVLIKVRGSDKTNWIKDFISGLSHAFQSIEKIGQKKTGYFLDLLNLNNMALSYPFLIKALGFQTDEKAIFRLARLLENLTFRYLLRGGRAELEARLNHHLIHYTASTDLNKMIDEIILALKTNGYWSFWSDASMYEYLDSGYFYRNRVDNYVLWKYELSLAGAGYTHPHNVSYSDLITNESIEHIAPQTPTDGEPLANGYGEYINTLSPEEGIASGEWLNCIGNLMLISRSHNSSIGNRPFAIKIDSYGRDNLLHQQREIASFVADRSSPVWDKATIEKRHKKILEFALNHWNLDNI